MSAPVAERLTLEPRLPKADRLVLWAIRAWVIGLKQRLDVTEPIRTAFGKFGIEEGADLTDALMSIVACGASRVLTVECICQAAVSDDEQRLLAAAALHQKGEGMEARFLLRTMLSPDASAHAGQILDRFGALLATAGLVLSSRPMTTERYILGPARNDEAPAARRPTLH